MAKYYDLTKTSYTNFMSCPKMAWLYQHKKDKAEEDEKKEQRLRQGNDFGEAAKGLLGKYKDVTERFPMGALNIAKMAEKTAEAMAAGVENICEAAFIYDRCYCAVDILHKTEAGWDIYEAKSSGKVSEWYLRDAAYQKYIIDKSGVKVGKVFIVHVNEDYALHGKFDMDGFFVAEDVTDRLDGYYADVEKNIKKAKAVILGDNEPDTPISKSCKTGYRCAFLKYCTRGGPEPNVFDLYRVKSEAAAELYNEGVISFEDIEKSDTVLSPIQRRQVEITLHGGEYIDREGIREFLDTLWYPMYFLDFETFQTMIPKYEGQKYNQQVPFQYSLHYMEKEVGELCHKEFIAEPGTDPRRSIAESLVENIPGDACVLAFYKIFECGRLKELAEVFDDLAESLLKIEGNVRDLLDVFQGGFYYNAAMGNSFSIKSVLPAVFPDNPELDYHGLDEIHNGLEASEAYFKMLDMSEEERESTKKNLLTYCGLDTYAMVLLWEKLKKIAKEEE